VNVVVVAEQDEADAEAEAVTKPKTDEAQKL
jgi:hypothetical protein